MFHAEDATVRSLLLEGSFGLERESLRVTADGFLAHTPNPFEGERHIVRDFSENQVEINTGVNPTPELAVAELERYDAVIQRRLAAQPETEYLWPFSNPPYIRDEADVPIARFEGDEAYKTTYREYLSDRYGRYKMAFSGIHFNYSFSEELLRADFALSGYDDFTAYKDDLYVGLAESCVAYGWMMNAITAASPIMDSSYVEQGNPGSDLYLGFGTVRCSELGYWNFFAPVLDYSSVQAYAESIQSYIDRGFIKYPSELYYPIRIKPRGTYGLDNLRAGAVSHIEMRMFDLNPLFKAGVNVADVFFGQLLLVWLASIPRQHLDDKDQVQAVQNFKNASHYDLRTVKIVLPPYEVCTVSEAGIRVLERMEDFYRSIGAGRSVFDCLDFQMGKFRGHVEERYTYTVRREFGTDFVKRGMELAKARQQAVLEADGAQAR